MNRLRKWFTVRRVVLLAIVLVVGWWFSAYPRGVVAAYLDHVFGHYEIKVFGLPPPGSQEYAKLVEERYGVKVRTVAGCVVTQDLVWYVDGYNSVSEPRIRAKFGKDIFDECWEDMRAANPWADPVR